MCVLTRRRKHTDAVRNIEPILLHQLPYTFSPLGCTPDSSRNDSSRGHAQHTLCPKERICLINTPYWGPSRANMHGTIKPGNKGKLTSVKNRQATQPEKMLLQSEKCTPERIYSSSPVRSVRAQRSYGAQRKTLMPSMAGHACALEKCWRKRPSRVS